MGKRIKGNSDGTAQDAIRVFYGGYHVTHTLFDRLNGFGYGCKKDTVFGNCLH
jgi:hypothetical protein